MPFEAAKAVAATFCYRIRYALAPLFGSDFVSMCLHPSAEGYGDMIISSQIVREATEKALRYREEAIRESAIPPRPAPTASPRSATAEAWSNTVRSVRPNRPGGSEERFEARSHRPYLPSPQPSQASKRMASPIHLKSKMVKAAPGSLPGRRRSPSPGGVESSQSSQTSSRDPSTASPPGTNGVRTSSGQRRQDVASKPLGNDEPASMSNEDFKAAWSLIQLHLADVATKESEKGPRKRRASS